MVTSAPRRWSSSGPDLLEVNFIGIRTFSEALSSQWRRPRAAVNRIMRAGEPGAQRDCPHARGQSTDKRVRSAPLDSMRWAKWFV